MYFPKYGTSLLMRWFQHLDVARSLPFFVSIRQGLIASLPLVMVGAFSTLLKNIPSIYPSLMGFSFYMVWSDFWGLIVRCTFGIAALTTMIGFAMTRVELFNRTRTEDKASPLIAVVVVVSCLFLLAGGYDESGWHHILAFNSGMFTVLLVAPVSCTLFLWAYQASPFKRFYDSTGYDPQARIIVSHTPAALVTILFFAVVVFGVKQIGLVRQVAEIGNVLLHLTLSMKDTLAGGMGYVLICQVLWLFGMHGPLTLSPLQKLVFEPAAHTNILNAINQVLPDNIFTTEFFNVFTRLGGSGSTMALIVAIGLVGRDLGNRRLALLALLPAMCNVNEPLLFGLPLILNPVYAIPFVVVPLLQTVLAYVALSLGWVPKTIASVNWTTPVFLSGYLATGSVAGVVLQGVNLLIGVMVYLPFVRISEKIQQHNGRELVWSLFRQAEQVAPLDTRNRVLGMQGDEGRLAEVLANDLDKALNGSEELWLAYQPQIDVQTNQLFGVEALLRWNHPLFGAIPPPLIVALADDRNWHQRLGCYVLSTALKQYQQWQPSLPDGFVMGVNLSAKQVGDANFADKLLEVFARKGVSPSVVEFEMAESTVLLPNSHALDGLLKLRHAGARIALDDFGMGHTSLRYLHALPIDTIKIDKSLTQAEPNEVNEHIIRSIVDLSRNIHAAVIVEAVETPPQLARFMALGCLHFQGYYFSRPLEAQQCLDYLLQCRN